MAGQSTERSIRRTRKKGRNRMLTVLFLVAFFGWLGASLVHNVIVPQLINLKQPEIGFIQDKLDVQGTIVLSETPLYAPATGKLNYKLEEGDRVKFGSKVLEIKAQTIENSSGEKVFSVKAPVTGLMCYHADGLEKVLTPSAINELELAKVDKLKANPHTFAQQQQVNKGDLIGKIVNNLDKTYMFAKIAKGSIAEKYLQPKSYLELQFGSKPDLYEWKVSDLKPISEGYLLILETRRFPENFLGRRQVGFGIVTKRYEGEIIPAKALVKKEGKLGVYIKYKESLRWKDVEVIGEVDDKVAVRGLAPETLYVSNPGLAREGQPVK